MSTLDSIFSDDSERITGVGVRADSGDASRLADLVGAASDDAVNVTEGDGLADLVGRGADDGRRLAPAESGPQLTELVGSVSGVSEPRASSAALASLVNEDVPQAEVEPDLSKSPSAAARPGRGARATRAREGRRDWASAAVAVVAVIAVVGVAAATVVTRVSTSPSDQALASLTQQEADLRNREQTLAGTLDRLEATREEQQALAADAAVALAALEGKSDPTARGAAETALDLYVDTLTMPSRVSLPDQYTRLDLGEGELAQVARALDEVREADVAIQDVVRDARVLLNARTVAEQEFLVALATFGSTIPSAADVILVENPLAAEPFRTAVTSLAAAITSDQRAGGSGLGAMLAYAAAVDALRSDNQRAIEEESARTVQPVVRNPGSGFTPSTPSTPVAPPTAPPVDPQPTDPPVDPEPTDPPVDPEPTDPPVDPEPTDPPVEPVP